MAALGDANGNLVAEEKQPTAAHEGPEAVLDRIAASIERLAAKAGRAPSAVGWIPSGCVSSGLPPTPSSRKGIRASLYCFARPT